MCTCTGRFSSTLLSSSKREATASCKICCGRPLVDGIGSVSSGMTSTVGLELSPDLTWKTVPKRNRSWMRRTRKPVAKSLTMGMGPADKHGIKLENVTVSESEKLGVDVLGRHFSEKVENVPIKKRRFIFQSPSPPSSLAPYSHFEASEQHVDFQPAPVQNLGSSAVQWKQLMKTDCSAKSYDSSTDDEKISEVIDGVGDLSGIQILAAAACGDSICNDVTEYKENPSVEESTQERIQSSTSSTHLEETTASQETASCVPKDSANESKSEGSSFQGNSFAVLHEFPSDKDTTPFLPLYEYRSGKGTDLSEKESKSEGSSFQDNSFDVLHEFPSSKDTTAEMSVPFPDDRLLWDLNVPVDAWPCGVGNVDSQKVRFDISEELQTKKPEDIKNDSANVVVSSDVDGGARTTSDLRTMPVGTADSSTGKQESGDDSQNVKNDTKNEVDSSDIDGGNRMTSDLRILPVGTDDLSTEKQESGDDSQNIKNDTTNEVDSSDIDGGNRVTSDLRILPVGTDDLSTEKQESGDDSQNIKDDTTIEVVSLDVKANNKITSVLRTMPVGSDDLTTEKQENEGCSGYDSQFEDGELRESDVQYWEEAEQVDYDTDFEEERSFGLEAESAELKVERGSNPELAVSFKSSKMGVASRKNSEGLKIRTVEVSEAETMKIDYLDGSDYDLRVDLSKESKKDLLACVEGSLSSDQKSRFDNSNGSYSRAERGAGSDKFMGSDRSSHMRGRSPAGSQFFNPSSNYWDSKRPHQSIYHDPYNFGRHRPKSDFENMGTDQVPPEAGGGARSDYRIPRQFMGSYSPLLRRRSPIERDDSYNMHSRMPTVRDTSPDLNSFRRYPQGVSRGNRDEYIRYIPDDSAQYMNRVPHRLDRRERSISPHGGKSHHTVPYKRARSRSRSCSPVDWLMQRDRNKGTRRRNRSPDFRSDARMDRVMFPFTKRFAAGYGEFRSPPRGRVSPQRNSRMFEDRNTGLDHFRGRKSHVRMFRQDRRFDQVRPIRRLNSNDNFNSMIRPRRFPDRAAGGKGCKYDEVGDDGKHGSRYAMINRERCYDTDGGSRRFQYNEDSYMAKNSLDMTNVSGVSSRHSDDGDDAHRTVREDS